MAVKKEERRQSGLSGSSLLVPLLSGGLAGTAVDVALYPIDTIKTRLQSKQGFLKAGGFRGIYNGLSAAAAGSAPGGAMFFMSYEYFKAYGEGILGDSKSSYAPVVHMSAAAMGEVVSCLVRVPTENVKQKMQVGSSETFMQTVKKIVLSRGASGFYTGYITTVCREIPFSFIQFPLYEGFKSKVSEWQQSPVTSWQSACCGSVAGAIAGALTTPLDVVKTRLMTSTVKSQEGMLGTLKKVYQEEGLGQLFSGVTPRVTFISIGGFVFFGAYETGKKLFSAFIGGDTP